MFRLKPLALLIGLLGTTHTLSLERSGIGNEAIVSQVGTANMALMIQQ